MDMCSLWLKFQLSYKRLRIENCPEVKCHSVACFPQGVKQGISSSAKVRYVSILLRFIAPTEALARRRSLSARHTA